MRRTLLLIVAFLSLVIIDTTFSQILFTENFSYTSGDSLTANGWLRHSGSQGQILVATPGLTYSGYVLSNIGNSARLDTVGSSGIDVNKPTIPDSTNSVYASFMVNVSYASTTGDYFFHVGNTTLGSIFRGKVFAKDSLGALRLGISKLSNTGTYSPVAYNYNTTYLIIIKYKFNTGSAIDDEVSMFIFSASIPVSEPGSPTVGPLTDATPTGDLNNVGTVALRQGTNTARQILLIDGIRVFKSWGNLVGITPITEVAEDFSLSQNYPNPFNPSTKINFSIPERSFVTLKVYDMLGKEVMELVNNNFSAGTYAVDMNANGLSTGIYMYSISASTESGNVLRDTKKLMLVK